MSKIAVISEHLTPQVLGLAQALHFQRHEVLIITSHAEEIPDDIPFQVLKFFKTWSAFEAIRFFPRLLGHAPDVWHFVFSIKGSKKSLPRTGQYVLARLAKALPRRVIAASFYESLYHTPSRKFAPMMKAVDIITTSTREQLMFIKRKSWINHFCETAVLPPFLASSSQALKTEIDQDLAKLLRSMQNYLLIPSERINPILSEDSHFTNLLKLKKLIICGSRPAMKIKQLGLQSLHSDIAFVGKQNSEADMYHLLKNSRALLVAFDNYSAVELLHFHQLCQQTKTPILASSRQAEALPGLCIHGKNGFILDQGLTTLLQLLQENPGLKTGDMEYPLLTADLTDSSLNELNRLYSKVQHIKTTAIDIKSRSLS